MKISTYLEKINFPFIGFLKILNGDLANLHQYHFWIKAKEFLQERLRELRNDFNTKNTFQRNLAEQELHYSKNLLDLINYLNLTEGSLPNIPIKLDIKNSSDYKKLEEVIDQLHEEYQKASKIQEKLFWRLPKGKPPKDYFTSIWNFPHKKRPCFSSKIPAKQQ